MRVKGLIAGVAAAAFLAACSSAAEDPSGSPSDPGSEALGEPGAPAPAAEPGWTALPEPPLSARHQAVAAWVDGSLVVIGGRDTPPCPPNADCIGPRDPALLDGARFDEATSTWSPIAPLPFPVEFASTAVVGGTLYLWADDQGDGSGPKFLALDLDADEWSILPVPDGEVGWTQLAAGLDGEVLLVQGSNEQGRRPDLRFDPAMATWQDLPEDPLGPTFDRDITPVGDRLVLTGIPIRAQPGGADGPARYRAATWTDGDGWEPLPPSDVIGYDPQWLAVGDRLVNPTTGGSDGGEVNGYGRTIPYGGILDPVEGSWSPLPAPPDQLHDGLVPGNLGDHRLLVTATGWALQVEAGRWFAHGLPFANPKATVDGVATTVGGGRLFAVGGARFDNAGNHQLLPHAWAWAPPG